jgi:GWxTD domain-containing protein
MSRLRLAVTIIFFARAAFCADAKTSNLPAPDQHWINEDVAYLISDSERAQFLSLPDEAARDKFVAAFWEERNPQPGNAENVFKEEHYRRIAYSNAHFATKGPGWKTDRGKTYIVLGPPSAIARKQGELPEQIWHYTNIQVPDHGRDVKFVDRCHCGDYQLER